MKKQITQDLWYIGVNDSQIDLFEGQYRVPYGMSYNSYVILDEKIAVFDTVDAHFTKEWLANLSQTLAGREPEYLVVSHMEPDHSANLAAFMQTYPQAKLVGNAKTFPMIRQFFGTDFADRAVVVADGDTLSLGRHTLTFLLAPMVHWPEVMVAYDAFDRTLFSADAFGKFGALDAPQPWEEEARRYYIGIVGKYGAQVQTLLKKAAALELARICPLHGPVLESDLATYLHLYDLWSSYAVEKEGIVLAYTSVYGHTKAAAELLCAELAKRTDAKPVILYDLARCDLAQAISDAFCYGTLVLAAPTYNGDVFPPMRTFLQGLTERGFRGRKVAFLENGSWAPTAARVMKNLLETCKELTFVEPTVRVKGALDAESRAAVCELAAQL